MRRLAPGVLHGVDLRGTALLVARPPMLSRREAIGFTLALLLHAAALSGVGRGTQVPIGGVAPEAAPLEVQLDPEPVQPEPAEAPRFASVRPVEPARNAAVERAPRGEQGVKAAPEPTATPAPTGAVFSVPSSAAPRLSDDALGLAGRNRFLGAVPGQSGGRASVDEGARGVAPGVDQSIRDALDARDHDLGLDVAGPLVAIAEELTRPSDTPMNGRAVFEIIVGADGNVREVRVLDVSDSRASWERLGAQLGATLRARRIAWRRKGHALAAQVEVTSRWVLPSGQAAGRVLSGPFAKASPDSVVAGVHFDVSDIGARPARDVHARILGERSF